VVFLRVSSAAPTSRKQDQTTRSVGKRSRSPATGISLFTLPPPPLSLSLSLFLSEIIRVAKLLVGRARPSLIYITHPRNADNREIDITPPAPRCSAMSSLPLICIQAYADKQRRGAAAHSNALTPFPPPPGGRSGTFQPKGRVPASPDSRFCICIYRCPLFAPLSRLWSSSFPPLPPLR